MTRELGPIVLLPGAGGDPPALQIFRKSDDDETPIFSLRYPGWRAYLSKGYTADMLLDDLVGQIQSAIPAGPMQIVGVSIGGHFGYAAALRLQALGREVTGFCAIDSYMMDSAAPNDGWQGRAAARAYELLSKRQFGAFAIFVRSRLWRAALRIGDGRWLAWLLAKSTRPGQSSSLVDPMLEFELSLRLLIQLAVPFVVGLDRHPLPLNVPANLLRTQFTSKDDQNWRLRCPAIKIIELSGDHQSLFTDEGAKLLHVAYQEARRGQDKAGSVAN